MKKITKILSIILLMFVLIINVKAVTITTNSTAGTVDTASRLVTNTGTLSITNVDSGDTFAYYKIIDVFYNSTTNNITYEFTSAFKTFLNSTNGQNPDYHSLTVAQYQALTSGNISNGSTTTSSTLDTLMSKYANYIRSNSISGTAMTTSSTTASATVAAGSYLVLPTSTQSVYAVMAGNVEFAGDGSGWTLNNATIVAKKSSPSITKVIYDWDLDETFLSTSRRFGIYDEIEYNVDFTIPTYPTNATNKTIVFEDIISSGIDFYDDLQYIQIGVKYSAGAVYNALHVNGSNGNIADNNGTVSYGTVSYDSTNNKITINFNENILSYNNIRVSYYCSLNDNAILGSAGNTNTAKLTYSNNPYGSGTTFITSTASVYTYGIKVLKKNGSNQPLSGAEIRLCEDSACNTPLEIWSDLEDDNIPWTETTDANGYATFNGLRDGTYYYQEVSAPNGYRIDNTIYSVTIDTTQAYTTANLVNVPLGLLPSTGGIGTYIYTAVGASLMIGAILLLMKKKKQSD